MFFSQRKRRISPVELAAQICSDQEMWQKFRDDQMQFLEKKFIDEYKGKLSSQLQLEYIVYVQT